MTELNATRILTVEEKYRRYLDAHSKATRVYRAKIKNDPERYEEQKQRNKQYRLNRIAKLAQNPEALAEHKRRTAEIQAQYLQRKKLLKD